MTIPFQNFCKSIRLSTLKCCVKICQCRFVLDSCACYNELPQLGGLNNINLFSYSCGGQKSKTSLTGLQSGVSRAAFPLEAPGGKFLLLPVSGGCSHSFGLWPLHPNLPLFSYVLLLCVFVICMSSVKICDGIYGSNR